VTADRRFWIVCALGGALVLTGCLLPTIEVAQEAIIGAGEAQQGFDYERTVRFAGYRQPGALLFLLGGAALVLLSIGALVRGSRTVLILAAAALSLAFVVETVRISDDLQWGDDEGLYACDVPLERCVPFIARATRDLQDEIRQEPEARRPGFELLAENGYRARGKTGWSLILWPSIVLGCVTAYRAFLLILRPLWAGVALGVLALLTVAYLFLQGLEGLE
jgi:hypothetical protein